MTDQRGPGRHGAPHDEERDPDWFGRTDRRQQGASEDWGQQYEDWPGESGGHQQAPSRDWYGSAAQGQPGYDEYGHYQDPRATHYAPPEPRGHGYDPRYEQAG